MSFSRKIKYFLVHTLNYTNKEAQKLIDSGKVEIDKKPITENCLLEDSTEIKINDKLVREKTEYIYLKFYKPVGFESSLNEAVTANLSSFFSGFANLSIAGRLDKHSEGLLLLSNDGKWVEKICHPDFEKEKEYEVILDKLIDTQLMDAFTNGILIGDYLTKPASCELLDSTKIRVILKEGKNRQIRRVCRKMGFEVDFLKRTRIDYINLENLQPGEMAHFQLNKTLTSQ